MCSIESLIRKKMQQYKIEMADDVVNAGRFDQRITQEERRSTLETLLHDEERYRETVHSVPSLQEVNRMIARSEEIGSSGSSSASQRLVRMVSPSLASQKLGSLSALDARSNDVSKTMPDELEEGEIVVSGDSRMDIEQSGSSFHDHEDDDGEQVLQRKIKRKRSTRIRPGHTVKRLREKHEKHSLQHGDSSPLAFLADHKIESRLRTYPRLKTHRKPVAVKHHPIDSATSSKVNVLPNPASLNCMLADSENDAEDATEHSKISWDTKPLNANRPAFFDVMMSDVSRRKVMALIAYLMEFKGNCGPHLIVVPNAVLVNWKNELHNRLPSLSCIFYVGGKDQRSKLFSQDVRAMKFNVLVTTYEFIMHDQLKLSKVDWEYVIIDEAQQKKDRESVMARDLDRHRCQRRLLLTGTPLQNDLKELWSLLNLLLPKVFYNCKEFHDWFSKPFQKDGPTHSAEDNRLETETKVIIIHRLHQILEPFMLRHCVEDVEGSLPPKVSVVLRCRMSGIQGAIYDWIKSTSTLGVDP